MKRIKKIKFSDHEGRCESYSSEDIQSPYYEDMGWDHAIAVDQWENEKITITVTADELSHLRPQGKFIQSKFKGSYQLVDVPFIPDNNQGVLI